MTQFNSSYNLLSLCLEDPIPSPVILAASSRDLEEELLRRSGPIPLGSRQTWMEIQRSDPDCIAVYNMKVYGEAPRSKYSNPHRNKIFKEAIVHKGLLVVRSFDSRKMREIDKVVVPPSFLDSILTVLHLKLNHPKSSQLKQVFERYFFSPRTEKALSKLYESCHLCISVAKYPKQLESYESNLSPDHPGTVMNVDILKREGQLILVSIDVFSSFVTSCFVASEKAQDLAQSIIQVTTPVRTSPTLLIRADKAPGFVSLTKSPQTLLEEVGIKLELAHDENKNSNCYVDKAIRELEDELRKLSPDGGKLNVADLTKATTILNSKIRRRGLTASEIQFSRDAHDFSNLPLHDEDLKLEQTKLREQNHKYQCKNRSEENTSSPSLEKVEKGDLVFMRHNSSKHTSRTRI